VVAVLGACLAAAPAAWLWGFTVDDALIPARYAAHVAQGVGYRFNARGPVTDGVTPLGWVYLLAPFASQGPLRALLVAKLIGLTAWTAAAAGLAVAIDRVSDRPARFSALALLAVSAPLAAWSVAGLETGLVTAIAAAAVSLRAFERAHAAAACAGLAAALRPELLPWSFVMALIPTAEDRTDPAAPSQLRPLRKEVPRIVRVVAATAPFLVVAGVRLAVFDRVVPLAVLAKPSDTLLGAKYALGCFLLTGPVALLAPWAWVRLGTFARGLLVAVLAHFVAIALAGGDWMPLSRLAVPVLPAVVLATAHVASAATPVFAWARVLIALAGELFVTIRIGPRAAAVGADRMQVIDELRPALQSSRVIVALDVGWVGAASDATLVDLAGLTDPAIALLPGGHTTKHIPATLLDARGADTLVLLLAQGQALQDPWTGSTFERGVENRIASIPLMDEEFVLVAESGAGGLKPASLRYVVLRRQR
jgi:hypothetical protein